MPRPRLHAVHVLSALAAAWLGLAVFTALRMPPPEATPPDTLVVALASEPRSLDPHVTTSLDDFRILGNVFEGLVRYAPGTLDIEPSLATSWTIDEDGLRYVFRLRPGVRFHDGTPLDADTVKFNFDRLRDPDHPQRATGPFPLAFFFDVVRKIEVLSPHEVAFTLRERFAPFLSNLAYPVGFIVSRASIEGGESGRRPVGTGPFRFREWIPDRRIVLERVRTDEPGVPRILFRPVVDPMTRIAALLAGQVDLVPDIGADHLSLLRRNPSFVVHETLGPHLFFLILNTSRAPFADVRVRRAVSMAIDRRAIASQLLADTAVPTAGVIPPIFDASAVTERKAPDIETEEARALVRASGAGGRALRLAVPRSGPGMLEPVEIATAIQADLRAIGLEITIETYEWNTFLARVNAGLGTDLDMATMAWMTNDPDTLPFLALRSDAAPPHGVNSGYVRLPMLDDAIERGRRTLDPDTRRREYRELDRLVRALVPIVPIASAKQVAVTHRRVDGFHLEPSFALPLRKVRKR